MGVLFETLAISSVTGRVKTSQCGGGQNQPVNMLPVYFM